MKPDIEGSMMKLAKAYGSKEGKDNLTLAQKIEKVASLKVGDVVSYKNPHANGEYQTWIIDSIVRGDEKTLMIALKPKVGDTQMVKAIGPDELYTLIKLSIEKI